MSETPRVDVNALWKYVVDQVKARTSLPSLWRAMEAARPLTVENDELILGYDMTQAHQRGLLLDNTHRLTIEQVLAAATRRPLRLRLIDGETLADWEATKLAEAEAKRIQQQTREQRRAQVETGTSWDAIVDQMVRMYTDLPHRALPSSQGHYLEQAVQVLTDAYNRLMPMLPAEQDERGFSRALDRVAERTGVPASLVAYLVLQRRLKS